ncbi:PREDICTED: uncharacterized protein LOC106819905 [Priapulus caudatus]|uniref:Uncharacterized protein LOC106819905 n=1 Tax=Priapulus caudatus TaxID=37621 RepID=A0ABM1F695_PRICU|nr:PREDICTED: uncharacterized protein LOC106819905 [Priapulus caudatus]
MIQMFKKTRRKFRQRVARSDSDEENHTKNEEANETKEEQPEIPGVEVTAPSETPAKEKKRRDRLKKHEQQAASPRPLVSFEPHDEEEGEVFKVRKSSTSRRIAKQLRREKCDIEPQDDAGGQDDAAAESPPPGEYSDVKIKVGYLGTF